MARVLVVFGTGTGCTEGVAGRIGNALRAQGLKVDVVPAKGAPEPADYDAVIVGSGVRAGNWHAPVKEWIAANAATLRDKPVAFYTACLTLASDPAKTDEVRAYTKVLEEETGVVPKHVGLFAGWNEPTKFSFIERTIMKLMKAPQGDFRDWPAIDEWAASAVDALGLTS